MIENNSDKTLVDRAQHGDKHAFDLLVLRYQNKIIKLLNHYIIDKHEVYDVTQDIFIKAFKAIKDFRSDSAFYTWLYRIAINTAKNYIMMRNHKTPTLDLEIDDVEKNIPQALATNESPEQTLSREELEDAIFSAFAALPEELKTAIMLRELAGLSYEQIAHIMDCPVGTIRSRIFRAREIIVKKLQPWLGVKE